MTIKLIALDMDGTTLNDQHQITPENQQAIAKAQQKGIEIVVSTGRSNTEMDSLWKIFPQVRYFSCSNGSKIYDRKRQCNIFEDLLAFEPALEILTLLKDFDVFPEIYAETQIYAEQYHYKNAARYINPEFEELIKITRTPIENLTGFLADKQIPVEKINAFFLEPALRKQIIDKCSRINVTITNALGINIEMNSSTASKGNALQHLCQKLAIAPQEVMAIGDGSNDISMLEFAGCSIAMENAVPEVKAVAKFATGKNIDSGVATAIYQYALQ